MSRLETDKYSTFWPRVLAGLIDGLVLSPLSYFDTYLSSPNRGLFVLICWTIFSSCLYWVYSVVLHARDGQTLGKKFAGIRVVNLDEDQTPTLRQAILRDIGDILISTLGMSVTVYLIASHQYPTSGKIATFILSCAGYAGLGWFLIEIATMFLNKKRRALHDLIAGTIVVRIGFYSLESGLGLNASARPKKTCLL